MSATLGATSGYSYAYRSVGSGSHQDLTSPLHPRHSRTFMSLLIAGSIATDHLMSFGGKFADSLVVEQLDKLSVSFLVEDLDIRRGGCAGNICFGLAQLGLRPVLVGAAGEDFADYRSWLERHGVDCDSGRISPELHPAPVLVTPHAPDGQV